jgi:hypothetical protein
MPKRCGKLRQHRGKQMPDKTWGPFSGRQIATMFVATLAFAGSGAVWAGGASVVNPFSYVALQDPVSGNKAAVDISRRVQVYDALQAAMANPANHVHLSFPLTGCFPVYVVPANRAFVLLSWSAHMSPSGAGSYVAANIYSDTNCDTNFILGSAISTDRYASVEQTFGAGIPLPAGTAISDIAFGAGGRGYIDGYLVPANWIPAPQAVATAEE